MLLTSAAIVIATAAVPAPASAGQWGYYPRFAGPDASMRIEVRQKQAQVFVDGYYAGIVDDFDGPFQRLRVMPGEHEIEIYLEGYHSIREKVYLSPDNTLHLKRDMERLGPGETPDPRPTPPPAPPGAMGPGNPFPQAPPQRMPMGRRRAPGAQPDEMPPPPSEMRSTGTLAVQVQPGDASVIVDGAPWRGPEGQDRILIELPPGRHTIELRRSGYRGYLTEVDIRSGETTPLTVTLHEQ